MSSFLFHLPNYEGRSQIRDKACCKPSKYDSPEIARFWPFLLYMYAISGFLFS